MILARGEKVHVVIRREFSDDLRRHFIGEVEAATDDVARVQGYMFVYDLSINQFVRRPNLRTQLFSIVDRGNMITVMPIDTILTEVVYKMTASRRLVLTDEKHFMIDVNEFGARY